MSGMTVGELIKHLRNFAALNPGGSNVEVMLQFDGDVCMEFGNADYAAGTPEQPRYLIFRPNQKGRRIGIRNVKIN